MPSVTKTSRRKRRPRGHAKSIPPNPFVALLSTIKHDVDLRLEAFFSEQLEAVAPHGREVTAMVASLARFCLRGGKRLRPALLITGFRVAAATEDLEPALDAGLALELLHTYLLVHDDWMDGDAVRRGGPSVHAELTKRFKDQRRGHSSAILAGDYALALATSVLARVPAPMGRSPALFAAFADMQRDAIIGQELDVASPDHDPEALYALKTGSYTVRGPLHLGALLGGAKPATLLALDRYALPVGIAFQLADDLLSAFGNPAVTGKALGNDLRAGKRTPLVLDAMRRARGRDKKILSDVFGKQRASVAQVKQALEAIERTGARERTEARIEALVAEGLASLDGPLPSDARKSSDRRRSSASSGRPRSIISRQGRELLEGAALALTARRV